MYQQTAEELLEFIEKCPTAFHVIEQVKKQLSKEGFCELKETDRWELEMGKAYYVTRNSSSLIAFRIPKQDFCGFSIIASHSDAPAFKLKEKAEMGVEKLYVKLNVEKYGGMICAPWMDRPLSIAGRVMVKTERGFRQKLINIDRDLVVIPNLAIHQNHSVNDGMKYNPQVEMLPLFSSFDSETKLLDMVALEAGVKKEDIIGQELFLYNRMAGTLWGAEEEFISSPKLDDLECAYCTLQGFLAGKNEEQTTVYAVFDNEEVGSGTRQGAASTFLKDTLMRINAAAGRTHEDYLRALAAGFMLSADNGHAVHPNHPETTDPSHRPVLNGGILLKHSANQKYTTDAVSAAMVRMICQQAEIPYQEYFNRSDMPGGSTLGNLSNQQAAIKTADFGAAQLSMHSPYETGGAKDPYYMECFAKAFYEAPLGGDEDGFIIVK